MKKHIFLTVILVIFYAAQLFPQGSGYMGKRFVINAEVINSPCYFKPNHKGNTGYFAFDYILNPSVEVIAGKTITLGASFMYNKSMYKIAEKFEFDEINVETLYFPETSHEYTAMGGGLFFKSYFGIGKRTPLMGNYFRIEINVLNVAELGGSERFLMGGGRFELGKDFLFFNRLKLNMGIGVGLIFGKNSIDDAEDNLYSRDVVTAGGRMFRNYFFGLRMGVGFLAF
ncbi:MAG: hypothetical protein LBV02_04700 [Bacteroidales bacterium]|jgi:hypothetical protein|nr:hypothetical protein [Bacteroidales bacterium]